MALFGKPQYSTVTVKKKDIPKDLWTKCPKTGEIIYNRVLKENLMVVPNSGYHFPLKARDRIASMLDEGTFEEMDMGVYSLDPLEFNATSSYPEKLKHNQAKYRGDGFSFYGCQPWLCSRGEDYPCHRAWLREELSRDHCIRVGWCTHAGRYSQPDAIG